MQLDQSMWNCRHAYAHTLTYTYTYALKCMCNHTHLHTALYLINNTSVYKFSRTQAVCNRVENNVLRQIQQL